MNIKFIASKYPKHNQHSSENKIKAEDTYSSNSAPAEVTPFYAVNVKRVEARQEVNPASV